MSSFIGAGAIIAARVAQGFPERVSLTRQEDTSQILEFEATIEEGHEAEAETTDHPVEIGADITDHIRRLPQKLTLKGIVSDYPILLLAPFRAEASVPGGDPGSRAKDAYDWLVDTKDQGLLLQVFTTLTSYSNMAIIGMSVVRDKDKRNILDVDLTLREIIIAETEKGAATTETGAASNLGRKTPTAAPAPVAGGAESILASLFGAV